MTQKDKGIWLPEENRKDRKRQKTQPPVAATCLLNIADRDIPKTLAYFNLGTNWTSYVGRAPILPQYPCVHFEYINYSPKLFEDTKGGNENHLVRRQLIPLPNEEKQKHKNYSTSNMKPGQTQFSRKD